MRPLILLAFVAVFVFAVFTYGSTPREGETQIHKCAAVVVRGESQTCR